MHEVKVGRRKLQKQRNFSLLFFFSCTRSFAMYARSIQNAADINAAVLSVAQDSANARPLATTKLYVPRQKEWREWCANTRHFEDGEIVTEGKLVLFLKVCII